MEDRQINLAIARIEYPRSIALFPEWESSFRVIDYCNCWDCIGPIIEREGINLTVDKANNTWIAWLWSEDGRNIEARAASTTKSAALCFLKMKGVEI